MKKMLFLFTAILLISCSDDDSSTSQINPPDWIIGTVVSVVGI